MTLQKGFHPNVNSNLHSLDLKEEALPLRQLDPTKKHAINILLVKFLKITKYAFTQNVPDAF